MILFALRKRDFSHYEIRQENIGIYDNQHIEKVSMFFLNKIFL